MFNKIQLQLSRYKLTLIGSLSFGILVLVIASILSVLTVSSMAKSRSNRGELIERDLKDIVGQFDTDERYVLEKNLDSFLNKSRSFYPLLLPRQYYVALPSGNSKFVPRPPPQNCYIKLVKVSDSVPFSEKFPDKFCAYFAENQSVGSYLFFSMAIIDNDVYPLIKGDKSLSADSIILTINNGKIQGKWWLFLQPSSNVSVPGRFQITAYRELSNGVIELDKRMEGWSYIQKQANETNVVNLLTRLDFKEFLDPEASSWPPLKWKDIRIKVSRTDKTPNGIKKIDYSESGNSYLSIPSLADSIFNSYATLKVLTPQRSITLMPPDESSITKTNNNFIQFVDGDLLIRHEPLLERSQLLQDTNITLHVTHPGTVIEKVIWQSIAGLGIVLFLYLCLAAFIFLKVLGPLFVLSRQSRLMIKNGMTDLPYSDVNNEIGVLSRGFNELLRETKDQAIRRREEIEIQEKDARRKHEEEVKSREVTLQFIGHEIRSPLQSLTSLHKSGPSKRYIDRMTYAITTLQNISGPESVFSNRQLFLEIVELNFFLEDLASNCDLAGIPNVIYDGPNDQIEVSLDPSVLEDAITNILMNANHHRRVGTPIMIKLRKESGRAVIDIINDGPHIPEENREKIFDLYNSTKERREGEINGIGLYAVRQYVSRMNGTISVSNEVYGVDFTISLPIKYSEN